MKDVAATAQALLARQMPGPWMWAGTPDDVALCTAHSGRHYLLGCERSGMDGAAFTFQFFDGDRPHIMHHAKKDGLLVPRAPYAPREIVGIDHPLADLIKMIPEMVEALAALEALVREGVQAWQGYVPGTTSMTEWAERAATLVAPDLLPVGVE